ncbi:MAG: hypothetical protein ACRD9R_09390 [Pyrinomonadaceae bacterium]
MPLSERARIEVYVPDLAISNYRRMLESLEEEFTYTFGGCTVIRGIEGSYARGNLKTRERVNLVYADTAFDFSDNFECVASYADQLKQAASEALAEEAILVVVQRIYHAN